MPHGTLLIDCKPFYVVSEGNPGLGRLVFGHLRCVTKGVEARERPQPASCGWAVARNRPGLSDVPLTARGAVYSTVVRLGFWTRSRK